MLEVLGGQELELAERYITESVPILLKKKFGFFRKKENNNDYLNEDIKYNILENPIESSLIGLAIGDAFGVPVEFKPRSYFLSNKVTTFLEFGTHNQPKGTWSDDTSMTIATMCSIIDNKDMCIPDIENK